MKWYIIRGMHCTCNDPANIVNAAVGESHTIAHLHTHSRLLWSCEGPSH